MQCAATCHGYHQNVSSNSYTECADFRLRVVFTFTKSLLVEFHMLQVGKLNKKMNSIDLYQWSCLLCNKHDCCINSNSCLSNNRESTDLFAIEWLDRHVRKSKESVMFPDWDLCNRVPFFTDSETLNLAYLWQRIDLLQTMYIVSHKLISLQKNIKQKKINF